MTKRIVKVWDVFVTESGMTRYVFKVEWDLVWYRDQYWYIEWCKIQNFLNKCPWEPVNIEDFIN